MASHLSSIGFPVQNEQDLYELAEKASKRAQSVQVDQGFYLQYHDPSGATLWLHADRERHIGGMNPHFNGPSVMKVKVMRPLHKPGDHEFEGSYLAWADPVDGPEGQEGAYPFLFDAPDFLRHQKLPFPSLLDVQIAAFAHELQVFPSEEAFHAEAFSGPRMAAEAFIPAGLFPNVEETKAVPKAHAMIHGRVLDAQKRTNQLSGKPFWWIQIQSYGGTYDAVIDPSLLRLEPRPGFVVAGTFWLSGMIQDASGDINQPAGFLRLLRGIS